MALPLPVISSLPNAPNLADPANFQDDAATFVGALAAFRASINSMIHEINDGLSNASILGTVRQSSGSPTGSLFEPGSNANGEYIRFADGTQICSLISLATASGAAVTWTFPAAFSASPVCSCVNASGATATTATITTRTPTSVGFFSFNASGSGSVTPNIDVLAIGRWF